MLEESDWERFSSLVKERRNRYLGGTTLSNFRFDEAKSFDANIQMFLNHMVTLDKTMGSILDVHAANLKDALDESRRRAARTTFNRAVGISLNKLTDLKKKSDSK